MKSILLIAPEFRVPGWDVKAIPLVQKKALMVPLNIATIAALTPDDLEVDLWDEEVHGRIDEETISGKDYGLVGITSHSLVLERVKEIAQLFRKRGIPVAVGGPGVLFAPQLLRDDADALFYGEAELTWPRFIADWRAGSYRKEYRQVAFPDMALSPPPRWDSIADQMDNYLSGGIQVSRGCPFDCEFCEIPHLYGRGMRYKPIDRVLAEVAGLERLGIRHIQFCESNFIGNPRYARDLLRELIPLNNSFEEPLFFRTDLSMGVAHDEEMLELFADANFTMFLIGIESPNRESLRGTDKLHNLRGDLVEDCKKIMSYGLQIIASMVIGFDHDTPEIFDQQFEFLQETNMTNIRLNLLRALHGSRLWERLRKEGRLLNVESGLYDKTGLFSKDNRGATNIIPKGMTRAELLSGYLGLVERVYDWANFAERVKGFLSNVKRQPNVPKESQPAEFLYSGLDAFLLSLGEEARDAIFDIFFHTRQYAPSMMPRVLGMVVRQFMFASSIPLLREAILKQMEFERSVDMEQFVEEPEDLIPESFREVYQEILPETHDRVYMGLMDKACTHEVLIEAFADFLARWEKTLPEQRRILLNELADRIIARENSSIRAQSHILTQTDEAMPDIRKAGLAEGILGAVEQELRAGTGGEH